MLTDAKTACEKLLAADDILILAHQRPDGDTLGGSFALWRALTAMGKRARVWCADGFSQHYGFLYEGYIPDEDFSPRFTVAVDVAALSLICKDQARFKGKVDLCIDHHKSNEMYAALTLLDAAAAAACEVIYDVIAELGAVVTKPLANAIFTGLTTDTGCFKYANVTARTHEIAARMILLGADHAEINKRMFDTKSRGFLMVEHMLTEEARFYFDNRCCVIFIPADIKERFSVSEDELDGISSFPARIGGVFAGVTIKEAEEDKFRVSVRTVSPADASKICKAFGGGGHINAAGCMMRGSLSDVTQRLLDAVERELG